jgi:bifunctional DNA-binding transcriptional regulator/antitoxin component of YhaV-PrlF toxin-antitoxin module
VTIPLEIRSTLGIEACSEVDFLPTTDAVRLVRRAEGGGAAIVAIMKSTMCRLSTEDIMSMTRDSLEDAKRQKDIA